MLSCFFQQRADLAGELPGDIGIFGCVFGEGFERDRGDIEVFGCLGFLCEVATDL